MSLPAGILMARIIVPGPAETDLHEEQATVRYRSTMDAMARGTEDGLKLYLQIIAMLVVTTSLVALAECDLGAGAGGCGRPLTLERMLGWLFAPLVWLLGVAGRSGCDGWRSPGRQGDPQ